MQYVYTLLSKKDMELYIGCTNNLIERVKLHNAGKVEATRLRRPLVLVHYEAFLNKEDAFAREKWLKTGWGRNHLKKTLYHFLEDLGSPSQNFEKSLGGQG